MTTRTVPVLPAAVTAALRAFAVLIALAALAALPSPAGAATAGLSAANLAHLEVADPNALGYYAGVDPECGFGDAELHLMVEDALIRHELAPHADARSPEGLNLDLYVSCFEPETGDARLFSVRAAFSIVQADGSDLAVNRDYGTFGRGDPAFIEGAVGEAVEAALVDFRAANARVRAEASI